MASRVRRTPPARRARPRARTASASPRVFGKAGSTTKKASGAVEPILPTSPSFCCIPERHPPLEHHSAGTRHGEQVAVPGRLGRVTGQRAMPAMITNELFNVGEESHRITSSARNSTDDGIVSPSAVAVLRLMTICNVVGCSTGTSAGFAPLRTLFPGTAARRVQLDPQYCIRVYSLAAASRLGLAAVSATEHDKGSVCSLLSRSRPDRR